jgi:succinoglycan biosynthesis transport protein ExoP
MEEEIDLRAYIAVLLKHKYRIGGLAVVAALVAFGVSSVLSPTYEATALVAITQPRYAMRFDPKFATMDNIEPPYKAYPDLAVGDEVLSRLIDDLGSDLEAEERSVRAVRGMVKAETGGDPSIVRLIVRNGNPERAARVANRWATLFVAQVNELYGQSEEELVFFEERLAGAQETLAAAEQDLIDFQAHNEAAILEQQLSSKQDSLRGYLDIAYAVRLVVQDAGSLQDRLRAQDASAQLSSGEELAALLLEVNVRKAEESATQLQISTQRGQADKTVGEQIALLDALVRALQDKLVALEQEAKSLEPDILRLQESLARAHAQEEHLTLARDVAQETVLTLSRKVAEARIAAQDTTGEVRLASYAVSPDQPVSPRRVLNTAIAGVLGLFVGVFAAFAIEYWRGERSETQ